MSFDGENSQDRFKQLPLMKMTLSESGKILPLTEDEKRVQAAFDRQIETKYLGIREAYDALLREGKHTDNSKELAEGLSEFPVFAAVLAPRQHEYNGKPYTTYEVVSSSGNMTNRNKQSNEHAEILALRKAAEIVGDKHLPEGYMLISTIGPCAGCAKAVVDYDCSTIVYGVHHKKLRGRGQLINGVLKPWRVEPEIFSPEEFIKERNPGIVVIGAYRENDVLESITAIPMLKGE